MAGIDFFLLSSTAMAAVIVDNSTLDIDSTTALTDYLVRNNGVLNVTGATTQSITIQTGSTLNVNGVTANGNVGNNGILINNSLATLNHATVTSDAIALVVNRGISSTTGSTASASNSAFNGAAIGAQITGLSTLTLINSTVTGTVPGSIGLSMLGGEVQASAGTLIRGDVAGVRIANDPSNLGTYALVLDGSTVQGVTGSAIVVGSGISASVDVLNNSSLLAGDGNLLAVQGAATAAMSVTGSSLVGNVNLTGNSTANLTFDQGNLTGDVLVESGSTANVTLQNSSQLIGRLNNANNVAINSGSTWTLTGNDTIAALAMDGGRVNFGASSAPATFYQLNVGTLSGTGTFGIKGNFASGDRDFMNVSGTSSGTFSLAVAASGLDAASPLPLTLVHTASGTAQFALEGGRVDLGTWSYDLAQKAGAGGGTDWYLDPTTRTISPSARSVLALFNTASTVWYGELTSLRSRMGELRFNGAQSGAWARTYGNKYDVAAGSGVGYQQTQQGFSLGADGRLGDSQWLLGVLAGYSRSDLDVERGTSGTVDSYYVGPYITWLDATSGYYFDGVLKFNHFDNHSKASMSDGSQSKGSYTNMGVGASAEFGRHIKLADDYFVEPFTQLSAVVIQARDYDLDNGMQAEGDRTRSLLGKVGATVGRNITFGPGQVAQPYLRAALVHEFAKNNEVQVNNNVFNNDVSGSRVELGAGLAVTLTDKLQLHADLDYAKGEHIEQPYGVNVGFRYAF
jgi:outer membrane autotransporter protein